MRENREILEERGRTETKGGTRETNREKRDKNGKGKEDNR